MSEPKKDDKKKEDSKSNPDNNNSDNKIENLEYSKKIGDYILFDQIGMGTFSKVTRAFHLITQQTVAVKILDKEKIEDEVDIERIIREIEILKNIHHPNIAQMYETYSTIHNFYLMLEYVSGGDLFDYITSHNFLSEKKCCYFFRQIISVLEYLIELGISHRDIKPENILLNEEHTQIKFIDFGLSNYCSQNELLHSSCGSPCYASPEMLSGHSYRGTTTDLWSAGIVLYSMLVGALPFDDQELNKLYEQIKIGKFYIPSTLSLEAIDLLKRILEVDPKKRINIEGVKNHAWFKLEENPMYKGINITKEHFPCDVKVVHYVIKNYFKEDKDITSSIFVKMVHSHECNKYTATYYLVKNNILGIEDKFKIRKDKKKTEKSKDKKQNEEEINNKEKEKDSKNNNKEVDDDIKNDKKEKENKEKENNKEKDKDKEKGKDKGNKEDLTLDKLINKNDDNNYTRNKNKEIKNDFGGGTMKEDDIFFFTGTINDNQNLRSKTEEDANKFFNTVHNKEIKQKQKYLNDDDIITSNVLERKPDTNEKINIKNESKNDYNKNKGKQNNNSKKKSNVKDSKKSNKKNNEIRTGKIDIPMLNINQIDNGIKVEEKCITERANNIKKNEKQTSNSQNKNINNIKTSKNTTNNKSKNMNQLIVKNPSKKSTKKNKTNSQESGNNNFNDINKKKNKDAQNGNNIFAYFSNDNKKVFDKIKINFKSNKNCKYAKSPSDINLLENNNNIKDNNNDNNDNNDNNQMKNNKVNNNIEFNEAALFSNRINYRNSSKSQNKFGKTTNNIQTNINANNPENKNIISCDKNISNNNGFIINQNNNLSKHFNINNQNKKKDKKKSLNIFSNYMKQKNIYNIFNNAYSKNQPHQRNYKSALKYQLTELKTENKAINNNFFTSNKISVSRNKKSSYNKDYNSVTNTNFITKNRNNNNIIKEYENKFINNNQKHSSSIDDDKINFSISPKYLDKTKNSKDKKIYFINQNILNIDYLLKGKNKKNKLILTSTIGNNNNNSPRNVYNIGQNYFGCEFHTEVNVKNNSTNKNKENLSMVLKKGIIKNQKKNSKDIFNLRLNKPKNNKNYSEQINAINNSNNVYSNKRNINANKKNKGF